MLASVNEVVISNPTAYQRQLMDRRAELVGELQRIARENPEAVLQADITKLEAQAVMLRQQVQWVGSNQRTATAAR